MAEHNEEKELEPFVRHGTKGERIEVSADEVLNAIAEGRDIDIEDAVIGGNLDIGKIENRLERNGNDRSVIRGNIAIQHSEIRGDVYFTFVTFSGRAYFAFATFSGDANFGSATFSRNVDFGSATFRRGAHFSSTIFSEHVYFGSATFARGVYFSYVTMERPANFSNVHFRENTVFTGLWNRILRPLCWPIVWLLTIGRKKLPKYPVTDFSKFNTTTVMDGSSNPYLKRYIDDEQWIQSWRKRSWWQKVLCFFWELTCHCGRSFGLWLFWSLVVAVLFGAVYADWTVRSWFPQPLKHLLVSMDPHLVISPESRIPTQFTPFYFSIVTFTTLGFGDVTPLNLAGEIWLTLEVFIGYIMLGGLISIFANKLARRA